MYIHTHIYIHICIYVYTYIYTHTHTYIPHFLYPFICCWAFWLLQCLGYCKESCNEHWGACIFLNYGPLQKYAQEWDCWIIWYSSFLVF